MQGYICGIADNSRINYCPHCGAELGVYAYYGDGSVVCDECDLHFAVIPRRIHSGSGRLAESYNEVIDSYE